MPSAVPKAKHNAPIKAQMTNERTPAKLRGFSRCLLRSRSNPISKPQPKAAAIMVSSS